MTQYSPVQIYNTIKAEAQSHPDAKATVLDIVTGTSIVLRESGGKSDAYRPASQNPNGGNDRGWWQINDKAHPDVSDAVAYDPVLSTKWVYGYSDGFTNFHGSSRWGDKPFNSGIEWANAIDAAGEAGDFDTSLSVGDVIDAVTSIPSMAADSISSTLLPDGLDKLLSTITSLSFWKRVGIGALGVALIVLAMVFIFGGDAVQTVKDVTP